MRDENARLDVELIESGEAAIETRAFRRALGHYATGVTVVTAAAEDQVVGVTANSFTSVSLDPPLIAWCPSKASRSLAVFRRSSAFAVNVLALHQVDLAARFAQSGGDKFDGVPWRPGRDGAPLIAEVAAAMECVRVAEHNAGDHVIMLGQVGRFARFDRPVLLFSQGRYGRAIDHPSAPPESGAVNGELDPLIPSLLMSGLRRAFGSLSDALQVHRDELALTVNEGRALWELVQQPQATIAALAQGGLMGVEDARDAVNSLVIKGWATWSSDAVRASDAGRDRLIQLRRLVAALEEDRLRSIPDADRAAARRVLEALSRPRARFDPAPALATTGDGASGGRDRVERPLD